MSRIPLKGLLCGGALVLSSWWPGVAAAGELNDLIARHMQWRGGAAFQALTSLSQQGELRSPAGAGEIIRWTANDGRSRELSRAGKMKNLTVVAELAWRRNLSGQVEDLGPAAAADIRERARLLYASTLQGADGAMVSLRPPEHHEGRRMAVVRVTFDDEDAYDLLLDPASGALHGVRLTEDRRTRHIWFRDWRRVGGVRIPFEEVRVGANPADRTTVRYTTAQLNAPPPPKAFDRPADQKRYAFRNGAHSTGWIPFDDAGGTRIFIPARVLGEPVDVLLDSGAEATVIDERFARRLELKASGTIAAEGTGGSSSASLASGVTIELDHLSLRELTVAVMDLSKIEARMARPLPIILGKEVFNQLAIDIDFEARRIAFVEPGVLTPPPGAVALPAVEAGGLRAVQIAVEGRAPIAVDLDLGNPAPLILYPAYWQREALDRNRPMTTSLGGAVGGPREERLGTIDLLDVAGFQLRGVPTRFSMPGAAAVDSARTLGNLGHGALKRFRLVTDFPHDRVFLTPYAERLAAPFPKDRTGLVVQRQPDRLRVIMVSPGSPAAAMGWRAGDEIQAVNGVPVSAGFEESEAASWRFGPERARVRLKLAGGQERTLTLSTYY